MAAIKKLEIALKEAEEVMALIGADLASEAQVCDDAASKGRPDARDAAINLKLVESYLVRAMNSISAARREARESVLRLDVRVTD